MRAMLIKSVYFKILILCTILGTVANGSVKTGLDGTVNSVKVLADGKILLGGDFKTTDSLPARNIVKIDGNGKIIDHRFGMEFAKLGNLGHVSTSLRQADGKLIIVVGPTPGNNGKGRLIRLLEDGTIDQGFDWRKTYEHSVRSIAQIPDGRLLIGFGNIGNAPDPAVIRLNDDGTIDSQFQPKLSGNIDSIVIDPSQGFAYVGGYFSAGGAKGNLVRLDETGKVDEQFGTKIFYGAESVPELKLRRDGKLLTIAYSIDGDSWIKLFNPSGAEAADFHPLRLPWANRLANDIDGNFYISGRVEKIQGGIRKYDRLGNFDPNFSVGARFERGQVTGLEVDRNGDLWVTGNDWITRPDSVSYQKSYFVEKFHPNGTPAEDFIKPPLVGGNAGFNARPGFEPHIHLDSQNGGAIVLGSFLNLSGNTTAAKILRLNSDYTVDQSFDPTELPTNNENVTNIFVDNLGRYLIAFGSKLYRLFPNGKLDSTFENGKEFGDSSLDPQLIQKIRFLSNGDFITISKRIGWSDLFMLRWKETGNPNESFKLTYGVDAIEDSKGRILLLSHKYDDIEFGSILRIGLDNEIDDSFNTGNLILNAEYLAVDSLDRPIIIGSKSRYDNRIFRLKEDGSPDESFHELKFVQNNFGITVAAFEFTKANQIRFVAFDEVSSYRFPNGQEVPAGLYTILDGNGSIVRNPVGDGFRFNNDGLLKDIGFLADGSMIVGGEFSRLKISDENWVLHNFLSRFNKDAEWDPTFKVE
jgi:uncharacterized delta-60 repeat protein